MKYSFQAINILTKNTKSFIEPAAATPLMEVLKTTQEMESEKQFNAALAKIIAQAKKIPLKPTQRTNIFSKEIISIQNQEPLAEKTAWGGVVLKKVDVEKDYIRKLLVVKAFGILGFEIHKEKLEKLTVLEGTCLILYRNNANKSFKQGDIAVKLATVGDKFTFLPGDEHGMIALTDCVVQETSTNHLDDLIYIFHC